MELQSRTRALACTLVLVACHSQPGNVSACDPPASLKGPLISGTWHATEQIDPAGGGYGSAQYSPEGDLFVFYSVLPRPDHLKLRIRRHGDTTWTPETEVSPNGRTANAFFAPSGAIHVGIENSGTAMIYSSTDHAQTWNWEVSFSAMDAGAEPVYDQAFVTMDGTNLNLFYGYNSFNSVVGNSSVRVYKAVQSGGKWPRDPVSMFPAVPAPSGVQGAYQDDGTILVLAGTADQSTDHGATFTQIAGGPAGIAGASRNPTTGKVFMADLFKDGTRINHAALWRTGDLGASLTKLTTVGPGGDLYRAKIAATQNLVVAVVTLDGGSGEGVIYGTTSIDEGCTWTPLSQIVDASSSGNTLNAVSLAASSDGVVSLVYSVEKGGAHDGVFLSEFH